MDENRFHQIWLPSFLNEFGSLNNEQKEETISKLLAILGPREKFLLQTALPDLLFRDLVISLPTELIEHIVQFMSFEDLVSCCLTCKSWNKYFSGMTSAWKSHAVNLGLSPYQRSDSFEEWKNATIFAKKLSLSIKSGTCFTHQDHDNLIKAGTYFSAISHDKDIIVAATCDPAHIDREYDREKLIFFNVKESSICKMLEVPLHVSLVKMKWPKTVICGHFDGSLTSRNLEDNTSHQFRGHSADVLSADFNEVSLFL